MRALERRGAAEPARQLALIRSWETTTLLVKNGPLTPADIERIRTFADERSFDLAYYPGIRADEANRYNLLQEPYFYEAAQRLIEDPDAFVEQYKFDLDTRDRRPAVLLRFLQVAGAAGALGGLGAVGRRAAGLGLSDPERDARCRRRS